MSRVLLSLAAAGLLAAVLLAVPVDAAGPPTDSPASATAFWTAERRAAAIPRDLVIDEHGRAHLRGRDGSLTAYGARPTGKPTNPGNGKGNGGSEPDPTDPSPTEPAGSAITDQSPREETVAGPVTFGATVTDPDGVKSVAFEVVYPDGGTAQTFRPDLVGPDRYEVTVTGFTSGHWGWRVVVKDGGSKGGATTAGALVGFTYQAGLDGAEVFEDHWVRDGTIASSVGRLYFLMDGNGYVCSGTALDDADNGAAVILTAAHCVYDDAKKAFASYALFIPDQDDTTGSGTDRDCSNDPYGCWEPTVGVVDLRWTESVFPDNRDWDVGFWVTGPSARGDLDTVVGGLTADFTNPMSTGDRVFAFGYSYAQDPMFRYCATELSTNAPSWWLGSCDLTGGSSGGPWIATTDGDPEGDPIRSVNSWGYTNRAGMGGPYLSADFAGCLFAAAGAVDPQTSDDLVAACP